MNSFYKCRTSSERWACMLHEYTLLWLPQLLLATVCQSLVYTNGQVLQVYKAHMLARYTHNSLNHPFHNTKF